MMGSVLQRGALVVVALLVLGWLGVLYRDRRVGLKEHERHRLADGVAAADHDRMLAAQIKRAVLSGKLPANIRPSVPVML